MAFTTQKDFLSLQFYNNDALNVDKASSKEKSLKNYDSCMDSRAWSMSQKERAKYLIDLFAAANQWQNDNDGADEISLFAEDPKKTEGVPNSAQKDECESDKLLDYESIEKQLSNLKLRGTLTLDKENDLLKQGLKELQGYVKCYQKMKRENENLKKRIKSLLPNGHFEGGAYPFEEIQRLQNVVSDLKNELSPLKDIEMDHEKCKTELEQYKRTLKEYGDTKNLKLMKQRSDILEDVLSERDKLREQIEKMIGIEEKIAVMKSRAAEADKLEEEIESLKDALNIFAESSKSRDDQEILERKLKDCEYIKEELETYKEKNMELDEALDRVRSQVVAYELELNSASFRLSEASNAVADYEMQIDQLTRIILELEQQRTCECNAMKENIQELQQYIEVNTVKSVKDVYDGPLQDLLTASRQTLHQIQKEFESRTRLEEEMASIKSEISIQKDAVKSSQTSRDDLLKINENLIREKERLENLLRESQTKPLAEGRQDLENEKLMAIMAGFEKEINELRWENEELRKTLDKIERANSQLEEELKLKGQKREIEDIKPTVKKELKERSEEHEDSHNISVKQEKTDESLEVHRLGPGPREDTTDSDWYENASSELRAALEECHLNINNLEAAKSSLEKAVLELRAENERVLKANQSNIKESEEFKTLHLNSLKELELKENELKELRDLMKNLEERLKDALEGSAIVDGNLTADMSLEVTGIRQLLEAKERELLDLHSKADSLEKELAESKLMSQISREEIDTLKKTLKNKEEDITAIEASLAELEVCKAEALRLKGQFESEKQSWGNREELLQAEIEALKSERERSKSQQELFKRDIESKNKEAESLKTSLEAQIKKQSELEIEMSRLKSLFEEKDEAVRVLQEDLGEKLTEIENCKMKLEKFEKMQESSGSLTDENQKLENELKLLQDSRDVLQKQLLDAQGEIERLTNDINNNERAIAKYVEDIERLEKLVAENSLKMDQQENAIITCSRALEEAKKSNEDFRQKIENLRAIESRLSKELDQKRVENEALENELEQCKKEGEQALKEFEDKINSVQKENEDLRKATVDMAENVAQLERLASDLGKERVEAGNLERDILKELDTPPASTVDEETQRLVDALLKCKEQLEIESSRNNDNRERMRVQESKLNKLEQEKAALENLLRDGERGLPLQSSTTEAAALFSDSISAPPPTPEELQQLPEVSLAPPIEQIKLSGMLEMENGSVQKIRETFVNKVKSIEAIHESGVQKLQSLHDIQLRDLIQNHNKEIESLRISNEAMRDSIMNIKQLLSSKADGTLTKDDALKIERQIEQIKAMTCKCGTLAPVCKSGESKLQEVCKKILNKGLDKLSLKELAYLHREVYKAGARLTAMDIPLPFLKGQRVAVIPSSTVGLERKIDSLQKEFENANLMLHHLKRVYNEQSDQTRRCGSRLQGGYAPCPYKEDMNRIQKKSAQVKANKSELSSEFRNSRRSSRK